MIDSRGYALEQVDPGKLETVKFASEAVNDNKAEEIKVVIDEFYAGIVASLAEIKEALPEDNGILKFGEPNYVDVIERIDKLEAEYMAAATRSQKLAIGLEIVELSAKIHYIPKMQEYLSYLLNLCV